MTQPLNAPWTCSLLYYFVSVPDPMVIVITENVTRFEGDVFTLVCKATLSPQVNIPVEVNYLWYYENNPISSNATYSILSNNYTYKSQLIIGQLQFGRDHGKDYKCTAILSSTTDPIIYLSSNSSVVYTISIDGMYKLCTQPFSPSSLQFVKLMF